MNTRSINSIAFKLLGTFRTHTNESSEVPRRIYGCRRIESLSKHKLLEMTYASSITTNLLR